MESHQLIETGRDFFSSPFPAGNILRPNTDMSRVCATAGRIIQLAERGIELQHGKSAAARACAGDRFNGNRYVGEENSIRDVNTIEIRVLVRIVGDDQDEGHDLRPEGMNRHGKLHRGERAVIFDVAAVNNAVDDIVLAIADGAGRRNDGEACRIMGGRAQADVVEILFGKNE